MHAKTRHGHCSRWKGWNSTLRFSWTHAQHRFLFDLLRTVNWSTSICFRLTQHPDNSTSTYSSACFVLFHQGGAKISPKCRLIRTYSRLMSTYSKRSAKQISNLSIVGEDGSSMHVRCMLRQDMANAHDWKVRILLFAFLEPTHSIDLSSTYSASWISLLRLNVDLFSTLMTRRRLIRQLASYCSTNMRQDKS